MLLCVDIGNTHTVAGLVDDSMNSSSGVPRADWRLRTHRDATSDELAASFLQQLQLAGHDAAEIEAIIISSVVPSLAEACRVAALRLVGVEPIVVGPGVTTGIRIRSDNPHEVGADRVVNSVAAWERYGTACIVVDMGTATTFDVISGAGDYIGGAIAPGLGISIDALVSHAARLASVELIVPDRAIGTNTTMSMQSGAMLGAVAQLDGMLTRIRAEMIEPGGAAGVEPGTHIPAIATGGITNMIAGHVAALDEVDEYLTLRGLQTIARRHRAGE